MLRPLIIFIFISSAAYAAESGGMPQLDPQSWVPQIFWLILTFGFLYLIISKIVYPRLSESIEQRNDYISDLIDEANKISIQTEKLNKEYEEFILSSKKEAQEIITSERKKLNSEFDKKKKELDDKILNLSQKAENEIRDLKSGSINQIKSIASSVSEELLINLSLKDTIDHSIITKKIDEISKKKIGDLS
ncbi:MAG: F0F1 ATP synthase subunit B [Pelagibacteraceae bacterium]